MMHEDLQRSRCCLHQTETSVKFWGVVLESGKMYAQVVNHRFCVTMAAFDERKKVQYNKENRIVTLVVVCSGIEYVLCNLKHGEIHQVPLNLIFDKGEDATFYIVGNGRVCLTGYQQIGCDGNDINQENEHKNPIEEIISKSRQSSMEKASKSSVKCESVSKSPEKEAKRRNDISDDILWNSFVNEINDDDNDDEDDNDEELDEDFLADEENESVEDDGDEESEEEEDETELLEETQELQIESRKRKKHEDQSRKRTKYTNADSTSEDAVLVDDNDSINKGISFAKPDTTSTPATGKKKKKKTKLLGMSDNSDCQEKSETNKSKKGKDNVVIEDMLVGKGPVAANGKILHVFYVGRLVDRTIFDSRVPPKKPFSFKLGSGQVIRGWDAALQGMRVGGKRKIIVPPKMGYGKLGNEVIPPNSTLHFIVELQGISS